jgi:hypothetical protein
MWWAASAMMSGVRERRRMSSPPSMPTAAVSMVVRGQRALKAMPSPRNSAAMPSTHMLMPYFAMV